jgi:hypothetical protein
VTNLADYHNKGLPIFDINLKCLIRIRAGPAVSNPVRADVVWIETIQISSDEDKIVACARRIRVDRHALS